MKSIANSLAVLCCLSVLTQGATAQPDAPPAKAEVAKDMTLSELETKIYEMNGVAEQCRELLFALCRTHGVVYRPGETIDAGTGWADTRDHLRTKLAELESEKFLLEEQDAVARSMDSEEYMAHSIHSGSAVSSVKALYAQWLDAKRRLDIAMTEGKNGEPEDNPEIRNLMLTADRLQSDLQKEALQMRQSDASQLTILREQEERLRKEIDARQKLAVDRGLELVVAEEVRRDFEAALARLETYKNILADREAEE